MNYLATSFYDLLHIFGNKDILSIVYGSVANGEGYQQKVLDNHTRDGILEHRNDVKEAEV